MTGLYLKHPHSRLIYDGKKSIIAQSSPIPITGTHILISKEAGVGLAYGLVTIAPPDTIDYDQFDSQFKLHRVTTKEREKWWSDSKSLLLYPVTLFVPYAIPLTVDVPAGVQMIMPEVKFIDANPDQAVKEVKNEPEDDMPWKASDAQSHTKLANTPAKQKQWASVANSALADCDGDVKECEASAIRQANSAIKKAKKKELSLDEISRQIRDAWSTQFFPPSTQSPVQDYGWVEEVFADHVIAKRDDGLYRYSMQITSDGIVFGEPVKVETVYIPIGDKEKNIETESAESDPQEKSTDGAEVEVNSTQDSSPTGTTTGADKESEPETTATTDEDDAGVETTKAILTPLDLSFISQPRKSILDRCIATIKDVIGWEDDTLAIPSHLPMVFKSKDGTKSYFLIWPTNSYVDRDDPPEAFRATALHDFVNRMDSKAIKSELQFWHLKQTKFGDIIWQDVIEDRFLAQIGVFDDTPVGDAFKQFFTEYPDGHPVIAPEGWGASHGYEYNPKDRQDGIYDWLHTDESTVLPLRYAANLLNPSPIAFGGKEMDDKRRDALREIGEAVGLDLVGYVEATAKTARELADDKVEHKEMKTEKTETEDVSPDEKDVTAKDTSAAEVQDTPVAANIDAIVAAFVEQAGLKELSEAFAALQARMDKLETTDEKRIEEEAEEDTPRYPFSWLLVKSEDESTILSPDEEKEFEDKKPKSGAGDSEIGSLLTSLHRSN